MPVGVELQAGRMVRALHLPSRRRASGTLGGRRSLEQLLPRLRTEDAVELGKRDQQRGQAHLARRPPVHRCRGAGVLLCLAHGWPLPLAAAAIAAAAAATAAARRNWLRPVGAGGAGGASGAGGAGGAVAVAVASAPATELAARLDVKVEHLGEWVGGRGWGLG